jgi:pimeloyl-ACP methyl ester carboxylesterase
VADLYAGLEIGRAALVGHGLGGAVALTLAARHPELVSHLLLLSPLSFSERPGLESRLAHAPLLGNLVFQQLTGRAIFRAYVRRRLLAPDAQVDNLRIDAFYQAFNTPDARGSALATLRSSADTRTMIAQTSRVRAPTLIVWGRQDRLYPLGLGQRLARAIVGARLELLDGGHALPEERPAELSEIVTRFLRDGRRPNA